jgi:hypothetical protein
MLSGKIYQLYKKKDVIKQSNRISILSAIDDPKKRRKKCCS